MTLRAPIRRALVLVLALPLLALPAVAHADRKQYERVADAYATGGGQLNACEFSQAELEGALAGIPPNVVDVVPDLRRAMEDAIAEHRRGGCSGREPAGEPGDATATPPPDATTTPAAPSPDTPVSSTDPATDAVVPPAGDGDADGGLAPGATGPPTTIEPAEATTTPGRRPEGIPRDRTPLVVGAAALGALLALALALWGWARMRGWDPAWAARARHACGEAAYRTTNVWTEFTDWLRLGR